MGEVGLYSIATVDKGTIQIGAAEPAHHGVTKPGCSNIAWLTKDGFVRLTAGDPALVAVAAGDLLISAKGDYIHISGRVITNAAVSTNPVILRIPFGSLWEPSDELLAALAAEMTYVCSAHVQTAAGPPAVWSWEFVHLRIVRTALGYDFVLSPDTVYSALLLPVPYVDPNFAAATDNITIDIQYVKQRSLTVL